MELLVIQNLLSFAFLGGGGIIAIRSLQLYIQARQRRLFIFGAAMLQVALAGASELVSRFSFYGLHNGWFSYSNQFLAFLFLGLSLLRRSEKYLKVLIRIQVTLAFLALLLLIPIQEPAPILICISQSLLYLSLCLIFLSSYLRYGTRYSLFMGVAFVIMSLSYTVTMPQYILNFQFPLDLVGNLLHLAGLLVLVAAIFQK